MSIFSCVLVTATFLCSLMAGFLFSFAVIVMPGIRKLGKRAFLHSFQVMDSVIQRNQPLFMIMWLGSTLSLIVAAGMAIRYAEGLDLVLVVSAALASIFFVQLPTMTINIPLNGTVQALDFDTLDEDTASQVRESFESTWNRWNVIRTLVSCVILAALLVVLLRF